MNYMEKKYKLTDETIEVNGKTLYRIEALKDFSNVKKETKGVLQKKKKIFLIQVMLGFLMMLKCLMAQ